MAIRPSTSSWTLTSLSPKSSPEDAASRSGRTARACQAARKRVAATFRWRRQRAVAGDALRTSTSQASAAETPQAMAQAGEAASSHIFRAQRQIWIRNRKSCFTFIILSWIFQIPSATATTLSAFHSPLFTLFQPRWLSAVLTLQLHLSAPFVLGHAAAGKLSACRPCMHRGEMATAAV